MDLAPTSSALEKDPLRPSAEDEVPECARKRLSVMILPYRAGALVEQIAQYRLLASDRRFRPVLIIPREELASRIGSIEGVRFIRLAEAGAKDTGHFPAVEALWQRLARWLPFLNRLEPIWRHDRFAHSDLVAIYRYFSTRMALRKSYSELVDCIRRCKFDIVLLPGDRELAQVPALCKAAHDCGVPAVISVTQAIPIDVSSKYWDRKRVRFRTKLRQVPLLWNAVAGLRHPDILSDPKRRLLFSPGWLISALYAEGMLNRNPWVHGNGRSSAILAEGTRKRDDLIAKGIPAEKIVLTGSILHDELYQAFQSRGQVREELFRRIGLSSSELLVVFAVPIPEHGLLDRQTYFRRLKTMGAALSKVGVPVLFSLHPKCSPYDYRFFVDDFGLHPMQIPISTLIAAADLYVCVNSTTIGMAALCGVPVINFDYAVLNLTNWNSFPGVVTVRDEEAFATALRRTIEDRDHRLELACAQKKTGDTVGVFDGKSADRFRQALIDLHALAEIAACASSA